MVVVDVNWFPLQNFGPPFPRGDATGSFKAGQMGWAFSWVSPSSEKQWNLQLKSFFFEKNTGAVFFAQ